MGLGLMLATSSAHSGEVELSIENRIGGDSNVFRTSSDAKSDGTFDISPRIAIRDDDEDVTYGLDYMPTYRTFFKTSGIDGVDHTANARLGWMISPVDKLEASGSYFNGRQFLFGTSGSGAGSTFTVNDRERIRISDANLAYRRTISERLSVRGEGFFDDFDASGTTVNSQTDSRAYTGKLSTQFVLTPRAVIGLSASGRRRENRAVGGIPPSQTVVGSQPNTRTDVWDVLALASYEITPTLSGSVQVGPSFIRQQQLSGGAPFSNLCQPEPCDRFAQTENRTTNLFASASITKQWKTSSLGISYLRSEARSGNAGSSSSINDDVQIDWDRRLSDRLTLRASGTWDRYEQISNQQSTSGRFSINVLRTTETFEFAITRRVLLIGQYTFVWQDQTNQTSGVAAASTDVDVNAHLGFLGLRYTFEPLSY